MDPQVIQKLVLPFSRMSYRPANDQQLFSKLETVLELKALIFPLATVNILMSLFQLGHFPTLVLPRVFSPAFISNVTSQYSTRAHARTPWPLLPAWLTGEGAPLVVRSGILNAVR